MEEELTTPTSACNSSHSCPVSPSPFAALPVTALKERIVEKIRENRVTLIVGETGCGKSSQVPQFLLEQNMGPVMCTQPRRFAVVAVATMVAKTRNCVLGEEVGYHIGHSKVLTSNSKIVFKTAGVLLDEMRDKGFNALNYKVIILDEVHERSVESDLVLVCVKQFLLRNHDLRVVLMSATADIGRYRDYFKDLGRGERVEVLAIPSPDERVIFQKKVLYLEQITELLGTSSESLDFGDCSGSDPDATMKPDVHKLICDLILHIHENDSDIEKGILVFLPTYRDLLQQWYLLKQLTSPFKVHVLHSSVDTSQALLAMRVCKSHRKVILATNIAESSVTIPNVAHVIDSCRSLQVIWKPIMKKDCTKLVWVSKSQADQRKGRTGRTCDGQIYRLVPRSFFIQLEDYECPAILNLSLRLQVLQICCASPKSINDPKGLLRKSLDPPGPAVVEDALNVLVSMKALEKTYPSGRCVPTYYGQLLANFALTLDAAVLIVKFGSIGLLREGVLLAILMDTVPVPILNPFGEEQLYTEYACSHYGGYCNNQVKLGKKEMLFLGNLNAYQFWQREFKDDQRMERLKHISEREKNVPLRPMVEEEWCSLHNLLQPALHHVSERYEDIMSSLHRFRPEFLNLSDGLPAYYEPYEYNHICCLLSQPPKDSFVTTAENDQQQGLTQLCFGTPFVGSDEFKTIDIARKFSSIIEEIKLQDTEEMPQILADYPRVNEVATQCVYFVMGTCNKGSQCLFSHSFTAKSPPCKFFLSLQGCRNGDSCVYSHDSGHSSPPLVSPSCQPEEDGANAASLLRQFPTSTDGRILLLDDNDLRLSTKLASQYDPSKIIATTSMSETSIFDPALAGIRILWGLRDPHEMILSGGIWEQIPWRRVQCVLWCPNLDSYGDDREKQCNVVQGVFDHLAVRLIADALYHVEFVLVAHNIKFSQLQVEKLGRESFFFLRESFPFDEATFGKIPVTVTVQKAMVASKSVAYVFNLRPPMNALLEDYTAAIRNGLWGQGSKWRSSSSSSALQHLQDLDSFMKGLKL
ncbi:DExH-box ATP-dependent RNA helicase DExH8 [Linum perenne]